MRFRVPKGWFVVVVSAGVALSSGTLLLLRGPVVLAPFLISVAAQVGAAWLVSLTQVVDVSPRGLSLYVVNRAVWADIVAAARARFFGLDYLKLRLRSGRTWWIPLYFRGEADMRSTLESFAPDGHPVKRCFALKNAG